MKKTDMQEHYRSHTAVRSTLMKSDTCPLCGNHTVNRDLRKCDECGVRLLFSGDDAMETLRDMDHFFIYHTTIDKVQGWFDKSFFTRGGDGFKY